MQLEDLFPYPVFRVGQRALAESVYNASKHRNHLVVEAMSGFGKTAPVLAGSLLAAFEDNSRVIYACRTKRQVFRVMEEVARIQRRVPLPAVHLFSKSDYCLLKEVNKFPVTPESFRWYCSFNVSNNLCSYFLNLGLNRDLTSLVKQFSVSSLSQADLLEACQASHLCPYEVARLAVAESMIVVTTYHYVLDSASKSVLFSNANSSPSDVAVVIDEAHNLRDFVRDSCTSSISVAELDRACQDSLDLHLDGVAASLKEVSSALKASSEHGSWFVDKASLSRSIVGRHDKTWLANLVLELSASASAGWEAVATGRSLPGSITRAGAFLNNLLSSYEEENITIAKSNQTFFLVETDPASRFQERIKDYRSLTLLSATINPPDLFLRSIGLAETTSIHRAEVGTIFHVQTVVDTGVSTRFKSRNPETYSSIACKVTAICETIKGGVGIFMPSYSIMEALSGLLRQSIVSRNILVETRNLSNLEADHLMLSFKSTPGTVLLAVQGGRFSEGEDFPGDQMDASVVVGLSLPPPSPVMYAEYAHTKLARHDTYLAVSLLPAVRKAIQSAGRHVRSPEKKGMIFLLDSRFNDEEVMEIVPAWIKHDLLVGKFEPNDLRRIISEFWSK